MDRAGAKPNAALGFLTVVEDPQHGLFGGYLVLNSAGRPLEFHCTAPVKPNRAQEILYGPTLEPFLYGEQIGQTLLSKAKTSPLLVCTDRPAAMAVRDHVQVPVALVLPVVGGEGIGNREEGSGFRVQAKHIPLSPLYSVLRTLPPHLSPLTPRPSPRITGGSIPRMGVPRWLGFNWDATELQSPRPTVTIAGFWPSGWALWRSRSI